MTTASLGPLSLQPIRRPSLRRIYFAGVIFLIATGTSLLQWRAPDYALVHLLNRFAARWYLLDRACGAMTKDMLSTVPIIALVCYAWVERKDAEGRAGLMVGLIVAFLSGIVSRALQLLLPTHPRPLHDVALQFHAPIGVDPDWLNHWSSFPSDHAAVLFGLAAAIYLADRKTGWVAFAFATIVNGVRIYCGYHFPSDVIGGAMLGVILVTVASELRAHPTIQSIAVVPPRFEPLFYAVAFYVLFGVATLWEDWRHVASGLFHYLHHSG